MKPKPVVTARICSACGLPWDDHDAIPTLEGCVRLLKEALKKASAPVVYGGGTIVQSPGWTSSTGWTSPPNLCSGEEPQQ